MNVCAPLYFQQNKKMSVETKGRRRCILYDLKFTAENNLGSEVLGFALLFVIGSMPTSQNRQ
jgi:hypothetical protein